MSPTAIFVVGSLVSLLCLGFLVFSFRELKRLGKDYDTTHSRG
jgi:hypothetical protein